MLALHTFRRCEQGRLNRGRFSSKTKFCPSPWLAAFMSAAWGLCRILGYMSFHEASDMKHSPCVVLEKPTILSRLVEAYFSHSLHAKIGSPSSPYRVKEVYLCKAPSHLAERRLPFSHSLIHPICQSVSHSLGQSVNQSVSQSLKLSCHSRQVYFLGADTNVQYQPSSVWLADHSRGWPWKTHLLMNAPRSEALQVLAQAGMLVVFCSLVENLPYVIAEARPFQAPLCAAASPLES